MQSATRTLFCEIIKISESVEKWKTMARLSITMLMHMQKMNVYNFACAHADCHPCPIALLLVKHSTGCL